MSRRDYKRGLRASDSTRAACRHTLERHSVKWWRCKECKAWKLDGDYKLGFKERAKETYVEPERSQVPTFEEWLKAKAARQSASQTS